MKFRDLMEETYAAVSVNRVRSGLTILGIVIGVSSVIAMVSIGQGSQNSIQSNIESLGANLIQVTPGVARTPGSFVSAGRGSAQTLTNADAAAIAGQSGSLITAVEPEVSRRYQVTYKGKNTNTSVIGTTADYAAVRNVSVAEGSFITDQAQDNSSKVAVLGPTVRDDLFGTDATGTVGTTIRINNVNFKVIGITASKGGSSFVDQDDTIYIPLSSAQKYLSGQDNLTSISVQAANQKSMSQVQAQVTAALLDSHHIADPTQADFTVLNQSDIVSAASSVTDTFTILLASIAGISLLVGGIGIMNMMLTTVTERTREIGLRKAIGGKRRDITRQFLAESLMLTILGGGIGVIVGWAISWGISKFAGTPTAISVSSVVLALGVSAAIGLVFGYYPARRAASLNPIEALRYE